jgi:hypothetical protein
MRVLEECFTDGQMEDNCLVIIHVIVAITVIALRMRLESWVGIFRWLEWKHLRGHTQTSLKMFGDIAKHLVKRRERFPTETTLVRRFAIHSIPASSCGQAQIDHAGMAAQMIDKLIPPSIALVGSLSRLALRVVCS